MIILEDAYSLSMKNENKEIARLIQAHLKEKLIRDRKPFSFKNFNCSTASTIVQKEPHIAKPTLIFGIMILLYNSGDTVK